MADQARYVVDIHLINGWTVVVPVTDDEANALAGSGRFMARSGQEVDPVSALFTIVAHAREETKKLFAVTDENARVWGIPGSSILAFAILDRMNPQATQRLGFGSRLDLKDR